MENLGSAYSIRLARNNEFEVLSAIKSDAYLRFGGAYIDRPLSQDLFSRHVASENISVVVDSSNLPCGYSLAFVVSSDLFLHHLFVKTSCKNQGLGIKLLSALEQKGRENHFRAITLCTTKDVPWNAPYYSKQGFVLMLEKDMPPYLKEELESDRRHFSPQNPLVTKIPALGTRVAMEKLLL